MHMLIDGLGEWQMDRFSNLKASSMRIQNILNTRTQKLDMLYVYLKKENFKVTVPECTLIYDIHVAASSFGVALSSKLSKTKCANRFSDGLN